MRRLHRSVRDALALITREKVTGVIAATARALARLGIAVARHRGRRAQPACRRRRAVRPRGDRHHQPAIADAAAQGIKVTGPFGADTMFHMRGIDAFVVMLHDQGHITAKLLAPNATAAMTIGTPILFSSVAHGSAHDIAGKGIASPNAMIDAILRLAKR